MRPKRERSARRERRRDAFIEPSKTVSDRLRSEREIARQRLIAADRERVRRARRALWWQLPFAVFICAVAIYLNVVVIRWIAR